VISGETRLVGLLGDPVSGSLSPAMQNAAFAARGLNWSYVPLHVEKARLGAALEGLVALGFAGANVTTPHKLEVAQLVRADVPSVNTLVVRDGRLHGLSTDAAILDELE
jgi:shikimate dehydrogenase